MKYLIYLFLTLSIGAEKTTETPKPPTKAKTTILPNFQQAQGVNYQKHIKSKKVVLLNEISETRLHVPFQLSEELKSGYTLKVYYQKNDTSQLFLLFKSNEVYYNQPFQIAVNGNLYFEYTNTHKQKFYNFVKSTEHIKLTSLLFFNNSSNEKKTTKWQKEEETPTLKKSVYDLDQVKTPAEVDALKNWLLNLRKQATQRGR